MRSRKSLATVIAAACLLAVLSTSLPAQQAPPAEGDEPQLIAVIQSDAPLFNKMKACQRLAVIGTKNCVPVLAKLLADEKLAHYARYGLEPIPDPSVDDALRNALGNLKGKLLVGVINSISVRRDAKALDDLKGLLGNSDPAVAAAAASALGRIATPQAVRILRSQLDGPASLRPAVADACLTIAEKLLDQKKQTEAVALFDALREANLPAHIQIAALHGAIRARGSAGLPLLVESLRSKDKAVFRVALAMAQKMPGGDVTRALVEELPKLQPTHQNVRQALVIYVLGARGDQAAYPVVLEAAKNASPAVRLAAVRVLAGLGRVSAVPVLLEAAVEAEGELAEAARNTLVEMPSRQQVDASLAAALTESEGRRLLVVIDVVGRRSIASTIPALLKLSDDDDQQVRAAAIGALGLTVGLDGLPALIDRLITPKTPDVAAAAKEALTKASMRMPDRDACAAKLIDRMASAPDSAKGDLLDLLGVVGGTKALDSVSAAAKDSNEDMQDAATRVLGGWMSPDAAPVLLELAKTQDGKFQVRSLRGYIRIIRQFGLPAKQRLAMCREAMAVAKRAEEKRLVLDALTRIPSPPALRLVQKHLDDAALKEAASKAAVAIAAKIVNAHPAAVADAMKKAAQATGDNDLARRARALLGRASAKLHKN